MESIGISRRDHPKKVRDLKGGNHWRNSLAFSLVSAEGKPSYFHFILKESVLRRGR
jgi:hypothetical protein